MKYVIAIYLLTRSVQSFAGMDPKDVPWLATLREANLFFFHVCGSSDILPTQKSLDRDFVIGSKEEGYFFTEAPGIPEYRAIITDDTTEEAKKALRSRFEKTHLWKYTGKKLTDLGAPTKMEFLFASTIKDCMAGAKNSLGMQCQSEYRDVCCSEKFAGPRMYWGPKQEYVLKYSPDPRVRLKVPGESKNRFCNFQQIIEVKGSGR